MVLGTAGLSPGAWDEDEEDAAFEPRNFTTAIGEQKSDEMTALDPEPKDEPVSEPLGSSVPVETVDAAEPTYYYDELDDDDLDDIDSEYEDFLMNNDPEGLYTSSSTIAKVETAANDDTKLDLALWEQLSATPKVFTAGAKEFNMGAQQHVVAQEKLINTPLFSKNSQAQSSWDVLAEASAKVSTTVNETVPAATRPISPTPTTTPTFQNALSTTFDEATQELSGKGMIASRWAPTSEETKTDPFSGLVDFPKGGSDPITNTVNTTTNKMMTPGVDSAPLVVMSATAPPNNTDAATAEQDTTAATPPAAEKKDDTTPAVVLSTPNNNNAPEAITNAVITAPHRAATTPERPGYDNPVMHSLWADTPDAPEPIKKAPATGSRAPTNAPTGHRAPAHHPTGPRDFGRNNAANAPGPIKRTPAAPMAPNESSGGMVASRWASDSTEANPPPNAPAAPGAPANGPNPPPNAPTRPKASTNAPTAPRSFAKGKGVKKERNHGGQRGSSGRDGRGGGKGGDGAPGSGGSRLGGRGEVFAGFGQQAR
jgi:uncharacterized membrane protein YgcG